MKKINRIGLAVLLASLSFNSNAQTTPQGVSIAPTQVPPADNAMLDVVSSEKGVLVPRVNYSVLSGTLAPGSIAAGQDGLLVFVDAPSDKYGYWYFDDNDDVWKRVGESIWKLDANDDVYHDHDNVLVGHGQRLQISQNYSGAAGVNMLFSNDAYPSESFAMDYHAWDDELHMHGGIICEGDVTTYGVFVTSDSTLKSNIVPVANAATKISQLRGVSYNNVYPTQSSNARGENSQCSGIETAYNKTPGQQYGVLAQEVEAVFPSLVRTDENGKKKVNYIGLIGPLIEATKQQQAKIETQEEKIQNLESQIENLLNRVSKLEGSAKK